MNSDIIAIHALKGNNEHEIDLAFQHLYNKYSKLVYLCILTIVGDRRDAEELTDDTFIKVFNNRKRLIEQKNIKYYILTIAKNLAIDFLRKKRIEITFDDDFVFSYVDTPKNIELESIIDEIEKCLNFDETELVLKHILFGETFKEMAEEYGKSIDTIKTKYFRAINKVHKEMGNNYEQS